jgi:hypothetical protein
MRTNQAKMDATLKEMRGEATARLEANMEVNNEKFHILVSRMGIVAVHRPFSHISDAKKCKQVCSHWI